MARGRVAQRSRDQKKCEHKVGARDKDHNMAKGEEIQAPK